MGQIIAKYGATKGAIIEIKDSLKWFELAGITKVFQKNNQDPIQANDELVKLGCTCITMPDGTKRTEKLEIQKEFAQLDARDAMRVIKEVSKLINEDDGDPKGNF